MSETTDSRTARGSAARAEARQGAILGMLAESSRLEVSSLAEAFNVTTETVRRDLIALESAGLAKRVHGGAVHLGARTAAAGVPSVLERARLMTREKRRIAEKAVELLPTEGLVILDAGTSVFEMSKLIERDSFLSFVSIGLPGAIELVGRGVNDVHTLGGELNPRTLAVGGDWALSLLSELTADVAFVGVSGITAERGATTTSHADAVIKRAVMASAKRTVVLADSSKLNSVYVSRFAETSEFDCLITDAGAEPAAVQAIRDLGVDVIFA